MKNKIRQLAHTKTIEIAGPFTTTDIHEIARLLKEYLAQFGYDVKWRMPIGGAYGSYGYFQVPGKFAVQAKLFLSEKYKISN